MKNRVSPADFAEPIFSIFLSWEGRFTSSEMLRHVSLAAIWTVILQVAGLFVAIFRDDIRGLLIRVARAIHLKNTLGVLSILLGGTFQYGVVKVVIWAWPKIPLVVGVIPLMTRASILAGGVFTGLIASMGLFFAGIPQIMAFALFRSGVKALAAGSRFDKHPTDSFNTHFPVEDWIMRNLSGRESSLTRKLRSRGFEVRSVARTLVLGLLLGGCYGAMILRPTLLFYGMLAGSDIGFLFAAIVLIRPLSRMFHYLWKPISYRFQQGPRRFRSYM